MPEVVTVCAVLYQGKDVPAHSLGIFSPEWADRLYRGIARHTTRPFRFVLFVDRDDYEFAEPIETRPLCLPYRNMISLLEPFRENFGRVVFMGLDTIITGNIDPLMDYRGPLAMLRDPYVPSRMCSGVMAFPWSPKVWGKILDWDACGWLAKPSDAPGFGGCPSDMTILNTLNVAALDDHVDGIVSYKAHVCDGMVPIEKTRIVYFHGDKKPHQLTALPWVAREWGGPLLAPIQFIDGMNNDLGTMLAQVRENMRLRLPWIALPQDAPALDQPAVIVGGGPSLAKTLPYIAMARQMGGARIFALNGAHDYLIERGIVPDDMVLLDSREENIGFVQRPRQAVRYLINVVCHPGVFAALRGYNVHGWACDMDGMQDIMRGVEDRPITLVGGGATVGLKTMIIAYLLGHRKIEFHGFDSCYAGDENHAYPQPMNAGESRMDVVVAGRSFVCAPWMAKQAVEFQQWARTLASKGCTFAVYGDGLIAHIMKHWQTQYEGIAHAS